jgi:hypothetical protein
MSPTLRFESILIRFTVSSSFSLASFFASDSAFGLLGGVFSASFLMGALIPLA